MPMLVSMVLMKEFTKEVSGSNITDGASDDDMTSVLHHLVSPTSIHAFTRDQFH